MKKTLLLTGLILVCFLLTSFTFADTIDPEILAIVQEDVDQTNATIDEMIDDAIDHSEEIVKAYEFNVKQAERELTGEALDQRLDSLFANKEVEINNLINNLVNETNAVAAAMFQRAEELGVTVVCELVPVEIDGRIVMIDPIRVVGI